LSERYKGEDGPIDESLGDGTISGIMKLFSTTI